MLLGLLGRLEREEEGEEESEEREEEERRNDVMQDEEETQTAGSSFPSGRKNPTHELVSLLVELKRRSHGFLPETHWLF